MSFLRRAFRSSFPAELNRGKNTCAFLCPTNDHCFFQSLRFFGFFESKNQRRVAFFPSSPTPNSSEWNKKVWMTSCSFPNNKLPRRRNDQPSPEVSLPFHFDPPFTEIPGERNVSQYIAEEKRQNDNYHLVVVYACQKCGQPIFISDDAVSFHPPAHHSSGWPTFSSPVTSSTLTYRHITLAQKSSTEYNTSVSARGFYAEGHLAGDGKGGKFVSRSKARSLLELAIQKNRKHGSHLSFVTPSATLLKSTSCFSQPSFPTNSSFTLRKSRSVAVTWREKCLRDSNQRVDPSPIEGCCQCCGFALCRICPRTKQDFPHMDINPDQGKQRCSNVQLVVPFSVKTDVPKKNCKIFPYKKSARFHDRGLHVSTAAALKAVLGYLKE